MNELPAVAYLLLPLLGGALAGGLCIRFGWLATLARPLDGGRLLRGKPLFGRHKTFRGVVAAALGTALFCGLQVDVMHAIPALRALELADYARFNGWWLGLGWGLAASLSELPNSLLKRQLGIAPGEPGSGMALVVFYVLDQVDCLLGTWLVLAWVIPVTFARVALSLLIVFATHQLVTAVGHGLGLRRTAT
jgi:hypothetical protein